MTDQVPVLQQLAQTRRQALAAPALGDALRVVATAARSLTGAASVVLEVFGPQGRVTVTAPDTASPSSALPERHGVPLWVGDRLVGVLRVIDPPGGHGHEAGVAAALELLAGIGAQAVAGSLPPPVEPADAPPAGGSVLAEALDRLVLTGPAGLQDVVEAVRERAAAAIAAIIVTRGSDLRIEAIAGPRTEEIAGARYPRAGSIVDRVVVDGTVVVRDADHPEEHPSALLDAVGMGALLALPLTGRDGVHGALLVARVLGDPSFDEAALERCRWTAGQVALALDVRAERGRALGADRDRIARDLHDLVIQRLYGAGLIAQNVVGALPAPQAERLTTAVEAIDEAIRQIRVTVFALTGSRPLAGEPVRARLRAVAGDVGSLLAGEPVLRFTGPVDSVLDEHLADDLEAVLREALTNVARHAGPCSATVEVVVDGGSASMTVTDDGVGPGEGTRSSGLRNLRARAAEHRGGLQVGPGPGGRGTVLRWWVPLSGPSVPAAGR